MSLSPQVSLHQSARDLIDFRADATFGLDAKGRFDVRAAVAGLTPSLRVREDAPGNACSIDAMVSECSQAE